jgi:DNA-nicking Smr family endonuclease
MRPPRPLSDEELALWQAVVRTAQPLKRKRKSKARIRAKPPTKKPSAPAPKQATPKAALPAPAAARPQPKPASSPVAAGIDKRQAMRLRRGQLPIEGRIDLHGSTQGQAHDALKAFLMRASASGKRCVLVITGKGRIRVSGQEPQDRGVLKSIVPRWLQEPALKSLILATQAARPEHGGEGALYVLLKRKR